MRFFPHSDASRARKRRGLCDGLASNSSMALEVDANRYLRLRQQLVMTPQLQQAIKICQLSLPELEAIVQSELEQNPIFEPLDRSTTRSRFRFRGVRSRRFPAGMRLRRRL